MISEQTPDPELQEKLQELLEALLERPWLIGILEEAVEAANGMDYDPDMFAIMLANDKQACMGGSHAPYLDENELVLSLRAKAMAEALNKNAQHYHNLSTRLSIQHGTIAGCKLVDERRLK